MPKQEISSMTVICQSNRKFYVDLTQVPQNVTNEVEWTCQGCEIASGLNGIVRASIEISNDRKNIDYTVLPAPCGGACDVRVGTRNIWW